MLRRLVVVGLALLTACGGSSTTTESTIVPSVVTTVATTSEQSTTTTTTTETRSFTHALGETTVRGIPQRIVTLEWVYTENVLVLGVQPIGVADIAGYNDWVDIPVALDTSVADVGTRQEPNLEQLAALHPDLIIAPASRVAETYAQLSQIAPTLAFDPYSTDTSITQLKEMQTTFRTIASVLGRETEAEAVLTAMNDYITVGRSRLNKAGLVGERVVLAQALGGDAVSIRMFTDNAMVVEIMEKLGLENAWQDQTFQQYGFSTISVETLPKLGDLNFLYIVQSDNNVFERDSIKPLWESLVFVQHGNVRPLAGDTWLWSSPASVVLPQKTCCFRQHIALAA